MTGTFLRSLTLVILFFTLLNSSTAQLSIFNKIDTFKGYNSSTYTNDNGFVLFNNPQNYNDSIKLRLTKFKKHCASIDYVHDFSTDSITGNFDPDIVKSDNEEIFVLLKARKQSNNPHALTLIKFDNKYNINWAVNLNNNAKNLISQTANLIKKGNLLYVVSADKQGNTAIICINPGSNFNSPVIVSSKIIKGIRHGSSTIDEDGNLMLFSSDSLYAKIRLNNQQIDTVVWAKKLKNRFFAEVNDPLAIQSGTGFRVSTVIIDTLLRKGKNQTDLDTAIYRLVNIDFDGNISKESDRGFVGPDYKVWPVELKNNSKADPSNVYVMTKNRVGFYTTDLANAADYKYYKFQKDSFEIVDAFLEILSDKSLLMSGFCYKKMENNEFNLLSPYLYAIKTQPIEGKFKVEAVQPVCVTDSIDNTLVPMISTKTENIVLKDTITSFFMTNQKFRTLTLDNQKFHENKCGKVIMKKPEPKPDELCPGDEFKMDADSYLWADYLWNDGDVNSSKITKTPGIYTVKISLCDTSKTQTFEYKRKAISECYSVLIPEVFIPDDQDTTRNRFITFQKSKFSYKTYSLKVFDRWGLKVFETEDPKKGWDGSFKETPMPAGVYLYRLDWEVEIVGEKFAPQVNKGQVLLLR